jgi:vacuolar-type H+-ATPase subunit C/Vma6
MTGAGRYAELAAAVRSFKAELIQPDQIERLVEAGTLSETVSMLTHGRLTSSDSSDLFSVEAYLTQSAVELAKRLVSYAPHDSRALIKLFSTGYELACAKEVLRSIADQVDPEEALRHLVPAGRFTVERCKELIEARNPNRVIDSLDDEGLRRFVAPRLTIERGGMAAVSAIDQYYYVRLWAASNLPDPLDAQTARRLIGELVDHLNIMLAFRARLVGLDGRSATDLMIPLNYGLGRAMSELAEANNLQNLMRILEKTPYARALETLTGVAGDGSLARVELALNRSHAVSCRNMFAGSPFNVGLALAFLFLKNYELHDLFAIINAKANKVPTDRVMKSLILQSA